MLAAEFAKDMRKTLEVAGKSYGLTWTCEEPIGNGREAVDVCGTSSDGNCRVLIEVELRRDEPVTNIIKVWRRLQAPSGERLTPANLIFIRAFSGHYGEENAHRRNAVFIGEQMQKYTGAKYVELPFKYRSQPGAKTGGEYRRKAARDLAEEIIRRLSNELKLANAATP